MFQLLYCTVKYLESSLLQVCSSCSSLLQGSSVISRDTRGGGAVTWDREHREVCRVPATWASTSSLTCHVGLHLLFLLPRRPEANDDTPLLVSSLEGQEHLHCMVTY